MWASRPVELIECLDVRIFEKIPTNSRLEDRKSWLAVQRALRHALPEYVYLEVGSHLGGSLQQHLLDPCCRKIYSIDSRPLQQPDDRDGGVYFTYEGNSTARMLDQLNRLDGADIRKLACFDSESSALDPTRIEMPPDLCFIDGEHTLRAALADFEFCLSVCQPNAAICFHDADIIDRAISRALNLLRNRGIHNNSWKLGGSTFLIALRDCPLVKDQTVRQLSRRGDHYLIERKLSRSLEKLIPRAGWRLLRRAAKRLRRAVGAA